MVIHFCCIVLMGKSNDHAFVVCFDELLLVIVVGKKWMMMMNHIFFLNLMVVWMFLHGNHYDQSCYVVLICGVMKKHIAFFVGKLWEHDEQLWVVGVWKLEDRHAILPLRFRELIITQKRSMPWVVKGQKIRGWSSGGLCPCARGSGLCPCARVPVDRVVPGCPCARASDRSRSPEVTRLQAVAVCLLIPQTVCPHWGVLTVGVKAGAWSGCSSLCSAACYL